MSIIEVKNIHFRYQSKAPILENLSLSVPKGSIYGFLGSNGAGKSTTIRNMLGLLKPQSGTVCLFGKELRKSMPSIFTQVGALIESPSLYPHLNGIDNLKIACKYQRINYGNIDNILQQVGLFDQKKKKVRHYSMGMKQRLGLGLALIHDPKLLILDEPTNGLDPNGINEMRQTLFQLQEEGKTILLSSHILAEIEKIASHVGILKGGNMAFEGSLSELEKIKSQNTHLLLNVDDPIKAKQSLKDKFKIEMTEERLLEITVDEIKHIPEIIQVLTNHAIKIYEAKQVKTDLEQMFLSITDK